MRLMLIKDKGKRIIFCHQKNYVKNIFTKLCNPRAFLANSEDLTKTYKSKSLTN